MWMWEYGIAHNAVMTVGWLMAVALLGCVIYFAIKIRPDDETTSWE